MRLVFNRKKSQKSIIKRKGSSGQLPEHPYGKTSVKNTQDITEFIFQVYVFNYNLVFSIVLESFTIDELRNYNIN